MCINRATQFLVDFLLTEAVIPNQTDSKQFILFIFNNIVLGRENIGLNVSRWDYADDGECLTKAKWSKEEGADIKYTNKIQLRGKQCRMRIFDLTISNRWRQFSDCMCCIHADPEAWYRVRQYYYNIYIVCVCAMRSTNASSTSRIWRR